MLGRPGEIARFELAAQLDSIFASTKLRLALLGAFAFLALNLLVAGAQNLHRVNTQGEACILLAKHYADGDFILAISSYWSPLVELASRAGFEKAGWDDLEAARMVIGLSGSLFWLGSATLLFAIRFRSRKGEVAAGGPLGISLLCLCAVDGCCSGFAGGFCVGCWLAEDEGIAPMDCVAGGAVALAIALPWWVVLSSHYGGPSIGSVWAIDRAVAGVESTDAERYHPCFGRLNAPAEGRLPMMMVGLVRGIC